MQSANRDAALTLVRAGLRIFPCRPDKTPMIKGWEAAASSSPFQAGIWWDATPEALPAIPVGAQGLVVIDCDRKSGIDGVARFEALCAELRIDLSNAFVVETPASGRHFYWRTDTAFGNSRGDLPEGIDVRGIGGLAVAPGAVLPDGRSYQLRQGSWDAIPALPVALAALLKPKQPRTAPEPSLSRPEATERERDYAERVLMDECEALAAMRPGEGRNTALNRAAHSIGTVVAAGWIDRATAEQALWEASERNGYRGKDGDRTAWDTLQSGLEAGMMKPRDPLPVIEVPDWIRQSVAGWIAAYKAKQSGAATAPTTYKRSVTLVPFSAIEEKPVEWLWDQYLPLGKLTLLAGSGGTGKSTIAFNFAGIISNGGAWPDGSRCRSVGNVIIWSSEDDCADTIKPRLLAVGANVSRCGVVQGATDERGNSCPFDAARDIEALSEAVNRIGGISLLIIDPIVSAVTGDMNKANEVRRSLQTIVDFAAETNCAVLGITHFAKGTAGRNSAERVIGSTAFKDFSRMTLVAAKDEESNKRVFTRAKSNNSADTGGFSYGIELVALHSGITATRVVWGEPLQGSSRAILAEVEGDGESEESKLGIAKKFLIETLRNGPVASKELFEHAREGHGVSTMTLRRAQKELGIVAAKATFAGGWMWSLPVAIPSR
jgi:hypothetical protein